MKKVFMFVAALITLTSCVFSSEFKKVGYAEETRKIRGFKQIQVCGSPSVVYTQGKDYEVRVKVINKEGAFDAVKTELEGDRLVVSLKNLGVNFFNFGGGDQCTVFVTSPDLIGVEVSGSGDFKSTKTIDTDNISLEVRGSGDISIEGLLICDNARMMVTGSGDIGVENLEAFTSDITLIGSGDLEVKQRKVKNTRVQLTGSGDIEIDCDNCGTIYSQLTGSGDISISGTVKTLNKSKAGSGDYNIDIRN